MAIESALDIRGSSNQRVNINAENRSRIFAMNNLTSAYQLTLSYMVLSLGKSVRTQNYEENIDGICATTSGNGGAICSVGELTLNNMIIDGSRAKYGGGILTGKKPLTLNQTTVKNNTATEWGGGIYGNIGAVTINNSDISSNTAKNGAGINTVRELYVNDSTIVGNTASDQGAGGILAKGSIEITGSSIGGNKAPDGAGIYLRDNASLKLSDSEVRTNNADQDGGGIYAYKNNEIIINNTEISDNHARFEGGGLYGDYMILSVADSIIFSNTTTGSYGVGGGGIYSYRNNRINLKNTTISNNRTAGSGGAIYVHNNSSISLLNVTLSGNSSGIYGRYDTNWTLENSIIANNSYYDCSFSYSSNNISLARNNILSFSGPSACGIYHGTTSSVITDNIIADPQVDIPKDNGCYKKIGRDKTACVKTQALVSSSPAIDAGDNSAVTAVLYDQRGQGYDRIDNGTVDIGAFETQLFNINITQTDGGTISCSAQAVTDNGSVTCNAYADTNYQFGGWGGDCAGATGNTCTLNQIHANKNVSAVFYATYHSLNISAPQHGRIVCDHQQVAHGETIRCEAIADTDYVFNGWTGVCGHVTDSLCVIDTSNESSATLALGANFYSTIQPVLGIIFSDSFEAGGNVLSILSPANNASLPANTAINTSGKASANAAVTVKVDGNTACTATANGNGDWACTIPASFATPSASLAISATSDGDTQTIQVNIQGAAQTLSILSPVNNASLPANTAINTSGQAVANAAVTVKVDGNTACTATANGNGDWACTIPASFATPLSNLVITASSAGASQTVNVSIRQVVLSTPTLSYQSVSYNSVTLNWNSSPNATYYEARVYDTDDNSSYTVNVGTGTTYLLQGLSSGHNYEVKLKACNASTCSGFSNSVSFATLVQAPQNVTANPQYYHANISWNGVYGASKYQVKLYYNNNHYVETKNVTNTQTEFEQLDPKKNYVVKVRAKVNGNYSSYSISQTFTLDQDEIKPDNVQVSVSRITATVTWDSVPDAAKYGVELYDYSTSTSISENVTTNQITFNNLKGVNFYWVKVRSYNSEGDYSSDSDKNDFTTGSQLLCNALSYFPNGQITQYLQRPYADGNNYGNGVITQVTPLQQFLNVYLSEEPLNTNNTSISVDGIFGEITETAVKMYQTRYGLVADGKVGLNTRNKINSSCH